MTIDTLTGGALIGAAVGTWLAPLSSMALALYGAVLGAAIGLLIGLIIHARRNGHTRRVPAVRAATRRGP